MRKEHILIKVTNRKQLKYDGEALIAYRYLLWACQRDYIYIIDHILKRYGISPFMYEKEDRRSPFMVAIENNQLKVVKMLLVKDYSCPSDPKLLRR